MTSKFKINTETKVTVVIPFRDRGTDLRRGANLTIVMAWWWAHGFTPQVVDDGLDGDAPFNRHRAYNRAVARFPETDVFVFAEADMLIPPSQIKQAVQLASQQDGIVVPFTTYRYLSDATTGVVRDGYHEMEPKPLAEWWSLAPNHSASLFTMNAESVMEHGKSIGAINIMSRSTIETCGGFTEATHGNWYDDNIIEEGYAFLTGQKTRWVEGPAVHMYHLPGWTGDHLTDADRAATAMNRSLLRAMRRNIRLRAKGAVRHLMLHRAPGRGDDE